jgi:hypothetical protein
MSPFNWQADKRPTIFATDVRFTGAKKHGKTRGQVMTETVERITLATGRSPGSLFGISAKSDAQIEEGNHRRRRA